VLKKLVWPSMRKTGALKRNEQAMFKSEEASDRSLHALHSAKQGLLGMEEVMDYFGSWGTGEWQTHLTTWNSGPKSQKKAL
jgi:hypothetical protein